jgi:pyridoxal phosphate enzyme (YggS family)
LDFSSLDKTITDDHFAVQGLAKLFAGPPSAAAVNADVVPRPHDRLRGCGRRTPDVAAELAPATEQALPDALNALDSEGAAARLLALRDEIARRARDCGREPESIKLVAVSKTFSADEVWPTIALAGQTCFGENRVQEAIPKWRDLRARAAALGKTVELHLIGPLQSNKAREAVETFDVIETVDRERIAAALAREIDRAGRRPRLFVEVNTGGEAQKAGVLPEDADAFIALCRMSYGLTIEGLMAIPPADEPVSPHFALLGVIAGRNGIDELSMGMSADWPLAVQLGATYVRIGSAIFGSRG